MVEKHEFGSPAWLRATCDAAEMAIRRSGADLAAVTFTFGEELLAVPARLNPTPSSRVGWHVQIDNGAVTSKATPPPADADSVTFADWEAVEPLAHHLFGQDPVRDAKIRELVARLESAGKLSQTVRRERPPALAAAIATLHNDVVAFTGPRLDSAS
jgi:hypothetical protein